MPWISARASSSQGQPQGNKWSIVLGFERLFFCNSEVKTKWILSRRFSTRLHGCRGKFCTSPSEHALSFPHPTSLVRAVTMATAHRAQVQDHWSTRSDAHAPPVYVTEIADPSKANSASMITVIFVFTSRWQILKKATGHRALRTAGQSCYKWITTFHRDFPAYLRTIHTAIPDTLASNSIITDWV